MGKGAPTTAFGKLFAREARAGDRLPYLRHVNEHTLETRDGMLLQVVHLEGFPFETADTEDLNHRHAVRETMLRSINNPRIALYHHIVRRRTPVGLESQFSNPLCAKIDALWQDRLKHRRLFVNDLFLTLVYKPSVGHVGLVDRLRDRLGRGASKASRAQFRAKEIRTLDAVRDGLIASLAPYQPRALGCYESEAGECSEPLEMLSLLYNGELSPVLVPEGDVGQYLPYKRLSFGVDTLELKGAGDAKFGAMVSIKDYPSVATPGLIDNLLRLPCEMLVSESYVFSTRQSAQERIDLALRRLRAADDDTVSLRRGLSEAKDDVTVGRTGFGEHHMSVLVRADGLDTLDQEAALVQAGLGDIGAIAVREDMNLEAAFWAQFPGNFDFIARKALISTANFAGFCSLHGFPIGAPDGTHWGPAISVLETTSSTPYYFSFHQGDLGNFVVVGPSGTGKTVVLGFLLAQAQKLQPQTIFFDKDRGAEIFLRAIGGHYDVLRQGQPTGFNPLQLADTPANRAFLRAWITKLVSKPGEDLDPDEAAAVKDAVDANFEQPPALRRLRYFRELLGGFQRPSSDDLAGRMAKWCFGGEYAWLFDNETDRLPADARIIGFDMTDLLEVPELRTPAMMYLFHRVEERLDGSPALIVVDEGWKALDDPEFTTRLRDWLKTIRKRNGAVGFCTQSARDALESDISSAIIEQTAVQILMPNPRAQEEDYCGGLGLSSHEFDIIRSLPEHSRCFLVKKGNHSVVARLDLSDYPGVLTLLSGREETVRRLDRLRAELGDKPSAWLPALLREAKPSEGGAASALDGQMASEGLETGARATAGGAK